MKKLFGVSLLSAMLLLGQPLTTFAADATGSGILNFKDIEALITKQNIDVRINQNDRLESQIGYSKLKRTIKDLKDDIKDIDSHRDDLNANPTATSGMEIVGLGAEKRAKLDAIETLERNLEDMPISVIVTDLKASISDDTQIRLTEGAFLTLNVLKIASKDISTGITTLQNQLAVMQLQQELGLVTSNKVNELKTKLIDLQTKLEGTEYQRQISERQLRNLLNDQENALQIGSVPLADEKFTIADKEADLKMALENSYTIALQEQQIVILKANLDRAEKDNGLSSNQYSIANYELSNAELTLTQLKDKLKSDYDSMVDDIAKKQSNLRLEQQKLEDNKVALSEANVRMSLGMMSKLELDSALSSNQIQESVVQNKQIELFNAILGYGWLLKGMPSASESMPSASESMTS